MINVINGLFIVSMISTVVEFVTERFEKEVPLENWANKELWDKDMKNNVPIEQRMKNLHNGKYKQAKVYPEPHRTSDGRIDIQNSKLYYDDIMKYGGVKACEWAKQGKYNLTSEQLKEEEKRIKEKHKRLYGC